MERTKMPREARAKQFMPFDALRGLKQALRAKELEHEKIKKIELSNDESEQISNTLSALKTGEQVKVEYYLDGFKNIAEGRLKFKINDGLIEVDGTKIEISSIIKLEKL